MSLLVDVREVPWRILEAVQARILANRERKQRREQAARVRGFTRPRPQQRRMGATMSSYRAPEPVPLILDSLDQVAIAYVRSFNASQTKREVSIVNANNSASITLEIDRLVPQVPAEWKPNSTTYTGTTAPNQQPGGDWMLEGAVYSGIYNSYETPPPYTSFAGTRTEVRSYLATPVNYENLSVMMLPVGAGAGVVVLRYVAAYQQEVVTTTIYGSNSFGLRGCTTPPNNITYCLYGWDYETSTSVETGSSSGQSVVTKTFLVTPSSVREIPVPAGLLSSIERIAPSPSNWPEASNPGVITYNIQNGANSQGDGADWYGTPNDIRIVSTNVYVNVVRTTQSRSFAYKDGNAINSLNGAVLDASALPVYGFVLNDVTSPVVFYGPGTFSFLSDYEGEYDEQNLSYTHVRETYLNGEPVPSRFLALCALPGGCSFSQPPFYLTFYSTSTIPEGIYTGNPDAQYRPATRRYTVPELDNHKAYYAWDWAQPAYCRQQLLALGFSEADLTP